MKLLSIETSCDETAISVIEANIVDGKPIFEILGNAIYSQAETHASYGGVFPSLAKREHARNFTPLLTSALKSANLIEEGKHEVVSMEFLKEKEMEMYNDLYTFLSNHKIPNIDAIAVTVGPGLEPALWVGINGARALAINWHKDLIPVNHMEGHITSVLIESEGVVKFPAVALLISGGHTELVEISEWGKYNVIGKTRDDAVGEAFDKVARLLNLQYPGGPKISILAEKYRESGKPQDIWNLPRPMLNSNDYDFSFSGLKTSVLYAVKKKGEMNEEDKESLACEFENAVTEVLLKKTMKAVDSIGAKTLIIGGGVSANRYIRKVFIEERPNLNTLFPTLTLSTDNSIMIGISGYLEYINKKYIDKDDYTTIEALKAEGNLKLCYDDRI